MCATLANVLAVHDPLAGILPRQRESRLCDRRQHPGPKYIGQRRVVEQVTRLPLLPGLGALQSPLGIHGGSRHGQMHMVVVVQAACMGMGWKRGAGASMALDGTP